MTKADYLTLFLYAIGLFTISTLSSKRNTNQKEMFSANRSSPWWASGLSGFMTMFSAGTFVVWGGIAYEHGIVAVVINTCYGVAALLIGYFVAGHWNKLGVSTPAEFVSLRFGKTGLHFFTWTMLIKRILGVSVSLYALAVLIVALVPLDINWVIIIFGTIVVVYTMQGGLWAVLMTDVLQFIVLTVVVLIVAILMISNMGSFESYQAAVPAGFFSLTTDSYGWLFLSGWVMIHFFMIGAEWAFVQRFISVKSPKDAKKASYLFGVMYLVTPLFWLLPPLLYRGQVSGVDKEQAYILAAQSVLPAGILGLMIAAMFSATASMVSSQLNVFAGVLTNDFYKTFLNPDASEKRLVHTGRTFTALLGVFLVVAAILVPYMGGAEKLIISINSLLVVPLFAPTLWGLFSKKVGIKEMLIVALVSFGIGLTLKFGIANNPMITEESSLYSIAQYLAENSKSVEVVVGVILPILLLFFFEWQKKTVDEGALRIQERNIKMEETLETDSLKAPFDPFPAQMVMYSLIIIGLWILILSFNDTHGRSVLIGVSTGLLSIALAIQVSIKKIISRTPKVNEAEKIPTEEDLSTEL
ncbi:MAG: Na+:solute symporter [Lentisphaeraceae bacterium]|nr:Na+:solute symporter [Lentisphaeraceae bacterium]